MALFNFSDNSNPQGNSNNQEVQNKQVKPKQTPRPKQKAEELTEEEMKNQLMKKLTETLTPHGFTKMEIMQVYNIIENADADLQDIRDTLNQIKKTNKSDENNERVNKLMQEMIQIQEQMSADIKSKITEIKQRKEAMKRKQ